MIMAERFIPGRELTCAVMGDVALGVIDIVPAVGFYDYRAKYAPGGSAHVLPADIPHEIYRKAQQVALAAHQALGCRGVSRADFRYDDTPGGDRELILLEVNTQPGMTRDLAGAGACRPCRTQFRRSGDLDDQRRLGGSMKPFATLKWNTLAIRRGRGTRMMHFGGHRFVRFAARGGALAILALAIGFGLNDGGHLELSRQSLGERVRAGREPVRFRRRRNQDQRTQASRRRSRCSRHWE